MLAQVSLIPFSDGFTWLKLQTASPNKSISLTSTLTCFLSSCVFINEKIVHYSKRAPTLKFISVLYRAITCYSLGPGIQCTIPNLSCPVTHPLLDTIFIKYLLIRPWFLSLSLDVSFLPPRVPHQCE